MTTVQLYPFVGCQTSLYTVSQPTTSRSIGILCTLIDSPGSGQSTPTENEDEDELEMVDDIAHDNTFAMETDTDLEEEPDDVTSDEEADVALG